MINIVSSYPSSLASTPRVLSQKLPTLPDVSTTRIEAQRIQSDKEITVEIRRGISRAGLDHHLPLRIPNSSETHIKYGFVDDASQELWLKTDKTTRHAVFTGMNAFEPNIPLTDEEDDEDADDKSTTSDTKTVDYSEDASEDTRPIEHLVETDRTSVSSSDDWTDCEFDKQASRKVRQLFVEIDNLLYNATNSQHVHPHSQSECSEWRSAFPHMRLLGTQITPCRETGFYHVPPPEVTPRPQSAAASITLDDVGSDVADSHYDGLSLLGRSLQILTPNPAVIDENFMSFGEEVLAMEGIVDEPIATDDRIDSSEGSLTSRANSRHPSAPHHPGATRGLPPLTPSLAVRDTVQSLTFDSLWQRISEWMRPLYMEYLRNSSSTALLDVEDDGGDENLAPHNLNSDSYAKFHASPPTASGFSLMSRSRLGTYTGHSGDLSSLLKISIKALNHRGDATQRPSGVHSPLLHDIPESPSPSLHHSQQMTRPKSGQQNPRVQSARKSRARLAPLDSRSRTPAMMDDSPELELALPVHSSSGTSKFSLRGRGIHPSSNLLYSSLMRSGTLPPLSETKRQMHPGNGRVGSGRPLGLYSSVLERPSTTHTQRSDLHRKLGLSAQPRGLDVHGKALRGYSGSLELEEQAVSSSASADHYVKVAQWGAFPSGVFNRKSRQLTNVQR